MPRQSKCCYCRKEGDNMTQCDSKEGIRLFDNISSRALNYIILERPLHERAELFYNFLIDILCVDELKTILSRRKCCINGNKKQLAARVVWFVFMRDLYLLESIENNELRHIELYEKYWRLLSEKLLIEANQELHRYFDLINQPVKFPINVVIKSVDLTEEEEQPAQSFECVICMEKECPISDKVKLGCGHSFCVTCVSTVITNSQNNKKHPCCGLCRAEFIGNCCP